MKIITVLGARPQFIKATMVSDKLAAIDSFSEVIIHTGQHFDQNMSDIFFNEMGLPKPDYNLNINQMSHGQMTAKMMEKIEPILMDEKPNGVLVYGDTNSTLAGSLTAAKLHMPVFHVEAGLRSYNRGMPEEINRMLTDKISDLLFTTEESANKNLEREGIDPKKIQFVGNVMADTLLKYKELASNSSNILSKLNLKPQQYAFLTMHRPSNVDGKEVLQGIMEAIKKLSREIAVVFPIHPRTKKNIYKFKLEHLLEGLIFIPPIPYWDMVCLMENSKLALTDSGGIQEETTVLNVPCLTIRNNTERPVTIEKGTNTLVGNQPENIFNISKNFIEKKNKIASRPDLWDGFAARRIIDILENWIPGKVDN